MFQEMPGTAALQNKNFSTIPNKPVQRNELQMFQFSSLQTVGSIHPEDWGALSLSSTPLISRWWLLTYLRRAQGQKRTCVFWRMEVPKSVYRAITKESNTMPQAFCVENWQRPKTRAGWDFIWSQRMQEWFFWVRPNQHHYLRLRFLPGMCDWGCFALTLILTLQRMCRGIGKSRDFK